MENLRDHRAQARIATRIGRLASGQFGDCKPLRDGIWELRIDHGPGYRIYYARAGHRLIVLFAGGDKRHQSADIGRAVDFWKDWQVRQT
jgi:putative addiction module killer protein